MTQITKELTQTLQLVWDPDTKVVRVLFQTDGDLGIHAENTLGHGAWRPDDTPDHIYGDPAYLWGRDKFGEFVSKRLAIKKLIHGHKNLVRTFDDRVYFVCKEGSEITVLRGNKIEDTQYAPYVEVHSGKYIAPSGKEVTIELEEYPDTENPNVKCFTTAKEAVEYALELGEMESLKVSTRSAWERWYALAQKRLKAGEDYITDTI